MSLLEALVLGLVQGLTEFLPISSSGHLVLVPALLGWEKPPVAFVVTLHGATLVAVVAYFARDFLEALDGIDRPGPGRTFALLLAIGTIPGAVVGFLFERPLSRAFGEPRLVALLLVGTGVILAATETFARVRKRDESVEQTELSVIEKIALEVSRPAGFFVGCAQAIAILPGISRSGATIGAGLLTGLSRPQAARFSFMLSVPILLGAAILQLPELGAFELGLGPVLVGSIAAMVSSYLAIAGMIGYLQKRGLYPFAAYCLLVGTAVSLVLSQG